jgi:hypothetical protein
MPPYHPAMMLKVLLYGYATGVTSSRKLEERLGSDVRFMFLAGQSRPGHKAIGEFRRRHLAAFTALFLDSLHLCRRAGLVRLGRVALDGTKVKANASRHKAMSYGRMPEREAALEAEVQRILAEAEAVDQAEARERTGDPNAVPDSRAQRNFTDPESRIMLSGPDGWIYGYNAQAVVDETAQVIVATDISTDATDTRQLPAMLDQLRSNTGRYSAVHRTRPAQSGKPIDLALGARAGFRTQPPRSAMLGKKLPKDLLRSRVVALAEMRVPDLSGLVNEVHGWPGAVPVRVPGGEPRIDRNRVSDAGLRDRIPHVRQLALE